MIVKIVPIVALDKIYFKNENGYFLDCTRLDRSNKLVSRKNPNDLNYVENLIKNIVDSVKSKGEKYVVLVDDVVFSGNVLKDGKILKAPYFKPFGNAVERASIPEKYEELFSNGCLLRSMFLWKIIEDNSRRKILIKDLPEKIVNTDKDNRVLKVLEKGLIYYGKDTNRNNGECR